MSKLDDFTLNVLCNSEVIDVNQDLLGKQARILRRTADEFILAKQMEDGSVAVGFFNLTREPREIASTLKELGARDASRVRDLWRQKEDGRATGELRRTVGAHGVALVRLTAAAR